MDSDWTILASVVFGGGLSFLVPGLWIRSIFLIIIGLLFMAPLIALTIMNLILRRMGRDAMKVLEECQPKEDIDIQGLGRHDDGTKKGI